MEHEFVFQHISNNPVLSRKVFRNNLSSSINFEVSTNCCNLTLYVYSHASYAVIRKHAQVNSARKMAKSRQYFYQSEQQSEDGGDIPPTSGDIPGAIFSCIFSYHSLQTVKSRIRNYLRQKFLVINCLLYYSFKFHNDVKKSFLSGHNEEIKMPKKRKSYEEDTSVKNIKVADGNENDNKSTRKTIYSDEGITRIQKRIFCFYQTEGAGTARTRGSVELCSRIIVLSYALACCCITSPRIIDAHVEC